MSKIVLFFTKRCVFLKESFIQAQTDLKIACNRSREAPFSALTFHFQLHLFLRPGVVAAVVVRFAAQEAGEVVDCLVDSFDVFLGGE